MISRSPLKVLSELFRVQWTPDILFKVVTWPVTPPDVVTWLIMWANSPLWSHQIHHLESAIYFAVQQHVERFIHIYIVDHTVEILILRRKKNMTFVISVAFLPRFLCLDQMASQRRKLSFIFSMQHFIQGYPPYIYIPNEWFVPLLL